MQRSHALLLTLAGALGLFALSRTKRGQTVAADAVEFVSVTAQRIAESSRVALEEVVVTAQRLTGGAWTLPASGEPYRAMLDAASVRYGLPSLLLHRVAWQESRFREDIISGRTVSAAGAQGIMQIVPRWHPGVDPLNPAAAIPYAAKYLRSLYDRFGSWPLALASYNWGQGNQSKDLVDGVVGNEWPRETRAYVADITADVGLV